ncbi:hypothetical protein M5C99_06060 [Acidovorax sp. NCPPB 2350]|nr:hypothetical protein M5C99_06060 [Acidovorax sp. NCPPB 2350]
MGFERFPLGLKRNRGKKTPAQKRADRAKKSGKCGGAASQLTIGNTVITDVSGKKRDLLPEVQKALDNVPLEDRAPWHGHCAEVGCVNQARKKGMDTTGGHSDAVNVGGDKHGQHKKACSSCRAFLPQFGICHDDE